ncbi:cysteine hydrolase family protein [Paeniglutamicibacter sp.]|uniref:cysteine hydrolase family protein n=1 Tax=Paeniglutamicibacter sp. TaxID=1934391 RepID=UPI003989E293
MAEFYVNMAFLPLLGVRVFRLTEYMTESLDISNAALVLVDVQQGFLDPGWGRSHNLYEGLANIVKLGEAWNGHRLPVVKVRHDSTHPQSTLRSGYRGNDLIAEVQDLREDLLVTKTVNSSFLGTPDLAQWFRESGITTIVVVGIQTNLCVETTARMGGNLGFDVIVPLDATATFDLEGPSLAGGPPLRLSAEDLMKATAVNLHGDGFARVTETADVLASLGMTSAIGRGNA